MNKVVDLSQYKKDKESQKLKDENDKMEQEYEEFIKLIKYFVKIQDCQYNKVTIDLTDDTYKLTGDDNISIPSIMSNEDTNVEDGMISDLITLSPKEIIINGSYRLGNEIKQTLKVVFEDKIKFN